MLLQNQFYLGFPIRIDSSAQTHYRENCPLFDKYSEIFPIRSQTNLQFQLIIHIFANILSIIPSHITAQISS
jgi:hypothetical protein